MSRFLVKNLDDHTVTPVDGVIKAEEYQLLLESRKTIQEIQAQAKTLYERRKKEGRAAGKKEATQLTKNQMIESVAAVVQYLALIEERFVDVVIESVEKIIGKIERDEQLMRMLKKVLYEFRNERRITLKVASDEAKVVRSSIQEMMAAYPNIEFIDVVVDHGMTAGRCRLEAETGSIETSIEEQIKTLKDVLRRSFTVKQATQNNE